MDFLIMWMGGVESQVIRDGYLSKFSQAMLSACGIDAFTIASCEWLSSQAKEQFEIPETELEDEAPSIDQSQADADQSRTKRKKISRSQILVQREFA